MGFIELNYTYSDLRLSVKSLIEEIEYGSTFALYPDREDVVPNRSDYLRWVEWDESGEKLSIRVDDSFWEEGFFFEKFLTVFVLNFIDFGHLRLQRINLQYSTLKHSIQAHSPLKIPHGKYLTGSIFKPYYHLSLKEKMKQAELYVDNGINVLKNDECFFTTQSDMLEEAQSIANIVMGRAYYVPNITSYIYDDQFIEKLMEMNIDICMVDFFVAGFRQVSRLKKKYPRLRIWGHRIGYDIWKNNISMQAVCVLGLLSGIDLMHIGTPQTPSLLQEQYDLVSRLRNLKPDFMPIFTKTTPELIKELLPVFGNRAIYMACGYFRDNEGDINWNQVKEWCGIFKKNEV